MCSIFSFWETKKKMLMGALYGGCGQVIIAGKGIRASHEASEKSVPYVLNVLLLYQDISFL